MINQKSFSSVENISLFPVDFLMSSHISAQVITALNNGNLNYRTLCVLKTKFLTICHISCTSVRTRKLSCNFLCHWKILIDQKMFTNFVLEDQQIIKRKVTLFKSHVMKNIKKWKFGFLLDLSGKEMRDDGNTTNVARCLVWECVRKVVLIGYTEGKIYELHKNRTLFSQP